MPFDCAHRARHGTAECLAACPTTAEVGGFRFARVERGEDPPPADPRVVDVALLDMHHGWPNLGHEALVHVLQTATCDLREHLARIGFGVRVVSYDIRRGHALPEPPGRRHAIYVGTGGPGHLDPGRNDGLDGSQGIVEDPAWEAPLWELFDAIREDEDASLFAVCHAFGVMCRWLGVADAVLRGPEKGGKSAGIRHNVLSEEGRAHPWFSRFARELRHHERFPILDNRLYDMLPTSTPPPGVRVLSLECDDDGTPGDAVTMVEVARASDRAIPSILGVNHHPEIVNRERQLMLLEKKRVRGGVDEVWLAERLAALTQPVDDDVDDRALHLTSSYTLMGPLRSALYREVHRRAQSLGVDPGFEERDLPLVYSLEHAALLPR
ncbi:MAG: hypothetical protein OEW19_17550 [Acidobacteriota bacterium]|nr:hypothetical protein [Acidobacteriota bacterium]